VKLLLDSGATFISAVDKYKALVSACCQGYVDCIQLLVQPAQPSADEIGIQNENDRKILNELDDDYGFTPLMHACIHNRDDCVNRLLDLKAEIDEVSFDGRTALSLSCSNNYEVCYRMLIQRNADVTYKLKTSNNSGKNARLHELTVR
jgi:ankyrin repeat protein